MRQCGTILSPSGANPEPALTLAANTGAMNSIYGSETYRQRSAGEIAQVRTGFLNGAALALVLWAMLGWVLVLLLR